MDLRAETDLAAVGARTDWPDTNCAVGVLAQFRSDEREGEMVVTAVGGNPLGKCTNALFAIGSTR